jgi:hypothetical protein
MVDSQYGHLAGDALAEQVVAGLTDGLISEVPIDEQTPLTMKGGKLVRAEQRCLSRVTRVERKLEHYKKICGMSLSNQFGELLASQASRSLRSTQNGSIPNWYTKFKFQIFARPNTIYEK